MRTKNLLAIAIAFTWFVRARSETFYGPSSATNKLLVGTNESVIISSVIAADVVSCDLTVSNLTYSVHLASSGSGKYALAGPAELRVLATCAVYLKRLQNAPVRMVLLAGNDTTNGAVASVPSGKTVEFFSSLNSDVVPNAYLVKSGQGSNLVQVAAGARLDGPVDVRFYSTSPMNAASVSYWFVEDVFQNPNLLVPSQSQTPQIIVEKSGDLQSWLPVAFFGQSLGSNTFYRLRISR